MGARTDRKCGKRNYPAGRLCGLREILNSIRGSAIFIKIKLHFGIAFQNCISEVLFHPGD
jgi:hypothetical protein